MTNAILAATLAVIHLGPRSAPTHRTDAAWYRCTIPVQAGVPHWGKRSCHAYPMPRHPHTPVGYWIKREVSRHAGLTTMLSVRYPEFRRKATPPPQQNFQTQASTIRASNPAAVRASGSYQALWLVTWYQATGSPMTNGLYPSVGWAACGYDVRLGARVFVPGVGTLTCGDRIGYDPYQHIDVFGIPLGSSRRLVTIFP